MDKLMRLHGTVLVILSQTSGLNPHIGGISDSSVMFKSLGHMYHVSTVTLSPAL